MQDWPIFLAADHADIDKICSKVEFNLRAAAIAGRVNRTSQFSFDHSFTAAGESRNCLPGWALNHGDFLTREPAIIEQRIRRFRLLEVRK